MARKRNIPTVVEAEQFILRDTENRIRAKIELKDGGPTLELLDAKGQPRIVILLETSGHALICLQSAGGASISLDVSEQGTAGLLIQRQGGIPTLSVTSEPDKQLQIVVYDKNGQAVPHPFDPRQRSQST